MFVLVTYDVSTIEAKGKKRLRKVAKLCLNYGQRVQNSVFECEIDSAEFLKFKHQMSRIIDPEFDSVRYYSLGNKFHSKVEHVGAKPIDFISDIQIL